MGVGDSQIEAAFTLRGPLAAGSWHLVGDGAVLASVDIQYDVIWRRGGSDTTLATFTHHFDPHPSGFDAVPFEGTTNGPAAAAQAGDKLVLRFTASETTEAVAFIPNGDGANANGRIPFVDPPPPAD
jgi:hypothetical protein